MFDVAAGFGNQFPQGEDGKILGRLENVVFFIGTQPHTVVGTTGVFEHKKNLSRGFFRDDVWD
jgi:hypothetical protein